YFAAKGIIHQTSVARTPKQNGVVERRNLTLVEAARTMLSAAKVPLFFWAEAIATACFTQNHSLVIPRHEKTPYHIINNRKPLVKFFHIFGSLCYIVRDGENLEKMKEKVGVVRTDKGTEFLNQTLHAYFDAEGILHQTSVARTPEQNGVVERRNRTLVEAARTMLSAAKVPLFFWAEAIATAYQPSSDPAPECQTMTSDQNSSDPTPDCQSMALNHDSLSPIIQRQGKVTQTDRTVTTSNELDLLFSLMFDELLNGSSKVVSQSSAVSAADAPNQRQQLTT
nr:putative ribonuclease H-like domain-containing protein [Tanacetum cinerariifolium]